MVSVRLSIVGECYHCGREGVHIEVNDGIHYYSGHTIPNRSKRCPASGAPYAHQTKMLGELKYGTCYWGCCRLDVELQRTEAGLVYSEHLDVDDNERCGGSGQPYRSHP